VSQKLRNRLSFPTGKKKQPLTFCTYFPALRFLFWRAHHLIIIFMCVELMLNAVNLLLIAFSKMHHG
jgi:hypothetical protein